MLTIINRKVDCAVRDNGIGIDKSQHEKVFDLFYTGDMSGKGTGAGLAIVKRIVEVHGLLYAARCVKKQL
ncbi:hypothetical protein C5S30_06430 [ANME-1 cluster archaeon GoMg4]|nr:hypothetical protein [ANME-1 cluster archaeon GoMg4]